MYIELQQGIMCVYIYIYIHMYVYMYVCVYIYIYIHMYTYMWFEPPAGDGCAPRPSSMQNVA